MAFCVSSADANGGGYTLIDNGFLKDYLPSAPFCALKVYLFGLCLSGKTDDVNNIEQMRRNLDVTDDDILDAYTYWEECGLVNIASKSPLVIEYVGASNRNLLKKISAAKYKTFNRKMQQVLCGRMISVTEYSEYYSFLENSFFDPDALVEIAKYCADMKGNDIGYKYILKIARDWDHAGIKSAEKIREKIKTQNYYNEELSELFKAMGCKRKIDIDDRQLYQKWTEEMGFLHEVIVSVAKRSKKQDLSKLDTLLTEYYKLHLVSVREIEEYETLREENKSLAIEVNRNLGLYYSDTRMEIQEYISPWRALGFSADTIKMIARFCFKCRICTLEGMDSRIKSLAQKGLIGGDAIIDYTENVLKIDKFLTEVLDALGVVRGVCAADRKNFNLWSSWGLSSEIILFAAKQCNALFNPMAALNKLLSTLKAEGVSDLQGAQSFVSKQNIGQTQYKSDKKSNEFLLAQDRTYTAEQLNAMFDQAGEEV